MGGGVAHWEANPTGLRVFRCGLKGEGGLQDASQVSGLHCCGWTGMVITEESRTTGLVTVQRHR